MKTDNADRSISTPRPAEQRVWIISSDDALGRRVESLLAAVAGAVQRVEPRVLEEEWFWKSPPPPPALIVLDVGGDADRGLRLLRRLKRWWVQAPMVVLTPEFSRDFGAKIISEGVHYYFLHEFSPEEFLEVAENVLKSRPTTT